jgi:chorismate-pyruvate lyase
VRTGLVTTTADNWKHRVNLFRSLNLGLFVVCILAIPTFAQSQALERLRADLLAGPSATQVLTQYCSSLKLASPPTISALRDGITKPAPPEVRRLLKTDADEVIRYRRVHLMCGDHILSDAENWYVPARLTANMNRMLNKTDTPFGTVVRSLKFHRKTLEASAVNDPKVILRITALLLTKTDIPFSLVIENYGPVLVARNVQK